MLSDVERMVIYSIMASLCEFKIKYNSNINISFDFINSVYALSYKYFSSKKISIRILTDVRVFKSAITNELISSQLASLDSSFNCVLNANNTQCEEFFNKFGDLAIYKNYCYDYLKEYIEESVYKIKSEKESSDTPKIDSIRHTNSNIVIEPIERIRLSENELLCEKRHFNRVVSVRSIEDISLSSIESSNTENSNVGEQMVNNVIYSSSEGKAIMKTLKKISN